jgi:beta-phosphoglucomutase-like phosphatase (HAD superfamily)
MTKQKDLARLLADRRCILLDFDGPVCGIFANHSAAEVASSLRVEMQKAGVEIPSSLLDERDPLEVLRWTSALSKPDIVRLVETKLCAEELTAACTAVPTRFGREVIVAAFEAGKPAAIVSNNSAGAIGAYVARHRLSAYAMPISGRTFARPDLMKPNPEPILRAAKSIGALPADCVLIGDSLADIEGARAAEMPVIGFANRSQKVKPFTEAGATLVVTSMAEIAIALIEMKL